MISLQPGIHALNRAIGRPPPDIASRARDRWVVAPASDVVVQPARFLPGQLDRIRGSEFGSVEQVVRDFRGGFTSRQAPTIGFRLTDADLVKGVLYAGGAERHLRPRPRRTPAYATPREVAGGAMYETWAGNRWFGSWLVDDCLTYPLARLYGAPVTTSPSTGHAPHYEKLLGMTPRVIGDAHFDELFLFDDTSQNAYKKARFDDIRERMIAGRSVEKHPGVFMLRGATGDRRVLANEAAIAERLARTRGFRLLAPTTASLEQIVDACAGAAVVAGVEGSNLSHALMMMPPGSRLFVIQPPARAVSVLKIITDRQGWGYSFVVGRGGDEEFIADPDEVERTLDLP